MVKSTAELLDSFVDQRAVGLELDANPHKDDIIMDYANAEVVQYVGFISDLLHRIHQKMTPKIDSLGRSVRKVANCPLRKSTKDANLAFFLKCGHAAYLEYLKYNPMLSPNECRSMMRKYGVDDGVKHSVIMDLSMRLNEARRAEWKLARQLYPDSIPPSTIHLLEGSIAWDETGTKSKVAPDYTNSSMTGLVSGPSLGEMHGVMSTDTASEALDLVTADTRIVWMLQLPALRWELVIAGFNAKNPNASILFSEYQLVEIAMANAGIVITNTMSDQSSPAELTLSTLCKLPLYHNPSDIPADANLDSTRNVCWVSLFDFTGAFTIIIYALLCASHFIKKVKANFAQSMKGRYNEDLLILLSL